MEIRMATNQTTIQGLVFDLTRPRGHTYIAFKFFFLVWKAKLRILSTWNSVLGYGCEMLQRVTSLPPNSPSRDNLIQIVKQKVEIYGDGIQC